MTRTCHTCTRVQFQPAARSTPLLGPPGTLARRTRHCPPLQQPTALSRITNAKLATGSARSTA